MINGTEASQPVKQSVASLIVDLAGEVACIAEETAKRTLDKLQGVMVNEPPINPSANKEGISREYPELFNTLRVKLQSIKTSLSIINDGLDRTEL
jgi:hypothetical protein